MKRLNILLSGLLLVMILSTSIGTALAYFTANTQAEGAVPITLGDREEINENFDNWVKHVTITSDEDSEPVFIRAKVFYSVASGLTVSIKDGNNGWSLGEEGYYYYDKIVKGGGKTDPLDVAIGNIPQDAEEGDEFNVVVIYESTPVRYEADGTAYADWDHILDTGTQEGGSN